MSQQGQFIINGQYIKDLSFENPNAPMSLVSVSSAPKIDLSVDINVVRLNEESFEVALKISSKATAEEVALFLVELEYAGIFSLVNIKEEDLEQILFINCPTILFPFARRVIADATRDGGFQPLMIEPIDFTGLYLKNKQAINKVEI